MWRKEDDIQRMLRDSANEFIGAEHSTARFRARRAGDGFADLALWAKMAEQGWTGILISEEAGGLGLGFGPALTLAEVLGAGLVTEPFVASAVISASVLGAVGDHPLTAALIGGSKIILPAFQERLNDWDGTNGATVLTTAGKGYALSGTKIFVPNWHPVAKLLVSARLGGEQVIVAVSAGDVGDVEVAKTADGAAVADVHLTALAVAASDIVLRGAAAETAIRLANQRGILAICAQSEGLSKAMFDMTVEYVRQRVQFGRSLASFQALRHAMVNLHMQIELASASWRRAADLLEAGDRGAVGAISIAKARASGAVMAMGKASVQYHGAFGYTEDADIGLFVNTGLRLSSWLGNAGAHRDAALDLHLEANHG